MIKLGDHNYMYVLSPIHGTVLHRSLTFVCALLVCVIYTKT